MFCLDHAGIDSFDVKTHKGAYCGIISMRKPGDWRVYFNFTATKGSKRSFPTAESAITFIRDRRIKKGWSI